MNTKYELANLAWPILVSSALRKDTIIYEDLARSLGYEGAQVTRHALGPLQDYCLERDLPPLTSIVIGKKSRLPGAGFIAGDGNLSDVHSRVFAFAWKTITRPFPRGTSITLKTQRKKSRAKRKRNPYEVPDAEVVVNGRGPYQNIFRKNLMRLYKRQCALCETKHSGLLIASHIVPWAVNSRHRLDPTNGILLCRSHDALFELGILRISPNMHVSFPTDRSTLGSTVETFIDRHTKKILRYPSGKYAPNPDFLKWKFEATASGRIKLSPH